MPPGQHVTTDFPILSAGPMPRIAPESWTLALQHGGRLLDTWTRAEFLSLPQTTVSADIHCVTKWSKLGTTWRGVTFDDLLKAAGLAEPPAPYVMAHCDGAYTTNLAVADLTGRQRHDRDPLRRSAACAGLAPAHGGPARLFVPQLYFWKSGQVDSPASLHGRERAGLLGTSGDITSMATLGKNSAMPGD
ncbi:MAG: molybdopterin-dependent oxidoreductase [Aliidongia sp.]